MFELERIQECSNFKEFTTRLVLKKKFFDDSSWREIKSHKHWAKKQNLKRCFFNKMLKELKDLKQGFLKIYRERFLTKGGVLYEISLLS